VAEPDEAAAGNKASIAGARSTSSSEAFNLGKSSPASLATTVELELVKPEAEAETLASPGPRTVPKEAITSPIAFCNGVAGVRSVREAPNVPALDVRGAVSEATREIAGGVAEEVTAGVAPRTTWGSSDTGGTTQG